MTSQHRVSQVRRLWLVFSLAPMRAHTNSWWLLATTPLVRWTSVAYQRRLRFWSCERRVAAIRGLA
jgi:hypothetical protein